MYINVFFLWLRFSLCHWLWEIWSWCTWYIFHASCAWDLLNFFGLWFYSLHQIWSIFGHHFFKFSSILPSSLHFRDPLVPWFGIRVCVYVCVYIYIYPPTVACRILIPHQGLNQHPRQWKHPVLIARLPRNSHFGPLKSHGSLHGLSISQILFLSVAFQTVSIAVPWMS